jgi:NADPH:quinone reductase-like Zn-dependent oxidoreductase
VKATIFGEHGGPEVLRYDDVPDPVAGPGEVVVKVGAVTVNHGPDTMVRSGRFGMAIPLPHVSGSDPAGEVVALGEGVDASWMGQRVVVEPIVACGSCDFCAAGRGENYCRNWQLLGVHCWGGRAEYVAVPGRNLVALPDHVGFDAAACLGMSYLTAYHGLVVKAQTRPDDTVLVVGASGGVGCACIQLARHIGARVIAVTGAKWKREQAQRLGADLVVDHADDTWPQKVRDWTDGRGVTVLGDNVGPATWRVSLGLLDRAGRFFCAGGTTGYELALDAMALYRNHVTAHFYMCGARADLVELVRLVAEGHLDPVIDSRHPVSAAAGAEQRLVAHEQFGKVVLVPDVGPSTST